KHDGGNVVVRQAGNELFASIPTLLLEPRRTDERDPVCKRSVRPNIWDTDDPVRRRLPRSGILRNPTCTLLKPEIVVIERSAFDAIEEANVVGAFGPICEGAIKRSHPLLTVEDHQLWLAQWGRALEPLELELRFPVELQQQEGSDGPLSGNGTKKLSGLTRR